jgi:RNA polymerase sigma factor (sigma-70 family)
MDFEDFVRRHQDAVYTVALRMTGHRQDAEDVAQEVFVRAHRSLAGYSPARRRALKERAWLATITLNLCRNRLRHQQRHPSPVPLDHDRAAPEMAADDDWWADRVARLPERYRGPLVLRHIEGLSYQETATALGRPVGTVKAQVHRAIEMLRTALEGEEPWTTTA